MARSISALLVLSVLGIPVFADDTDPEPPAKGAIVKSGDLTVVARGGSITATDKDQKVIWQVRLEKSKIEKPPQLGLAGTRAISARGDTVTTYDVKTGKTLWTSSSPFYSGTKMTVNGELITLTRDDSTVMVDVQTGRMTRRGFKDGPKKE